MLVVYIISDIDKALAFEWISDSFHQRNISISFILLNPKNSGIEQYLLSNSLSVIRISVRGKKDWPGALGKIKRLLKQWNPEVVHCHLFQAAILGLSAAWWLKTPKRIFTRHHATLHHQYHKKGVLWDKLCNTLATDIVAVSKNVKNILVDRENVAPEKVHVIPHGFQWDEFRKVTSGQVRLLKNRYTLGNESFVIGCIARFTEWKGIQYLIPAFKRFHRKHPQAILVLANAYGDYAPHINTLLDDLPSNSYRLISFESALGVLYQCFDLFVHVPIDPYIEAFGQIYIEALAAGVPSVFTLSGIAHEVVQHEKNALVVPFRDDDAIYNALERLWGEPLLREQLSREGWKSVQKEFRLEKMIDRLEALYEK
ncbi:MAG: glycosyltransferase family 1 protein [Candidatus Electrothrix sp. LOE2]|nr:glycosyltransferase family 1 protein [Candidatus Electrothrix sp. LOE2]